MKRSSLAAATPMAVHLWVMCSTFGNNFPVLGVLCFAVGACQCRPMLYSGFSVCVHFAATVQSADCVCCSRDVAARCAQRLRPVCWAFSCRRCWSVW
ncbi:hypothetical protein KCP73_20685 [Salmonella enterica subsp. enterica]|nr:hypothetical protein KCP73_20685 [Salmonella enterica subsp. enterica]